MEIYDSLKYFFYILRPFGLAPFGFDLKARKLKTKFTNIFNLTCLVPLICMIFWHMTAFRFSNSQTGFQSSMLDCLWQYQFMIQHFLAVFVIIFNVLKRRNIEKLLLKLSEFDKRTQKLDWKYKAKDLNPFIMPAIIVCSSTLMTTYLTIGRFTIDIYKSLVTTHWLYAAVALDYVWIQQFFFALSLEFVLSVWSIKTRLKALTKNFKLLTICKKN